MPKGTEHKSWLNFAVTFMDFDLTIRKLPFESWKSGIIILKKTLECWSLKQELIQNWLQYQKDPMLSSLVVPWHLKMVLPYLFIGVSQ